MMPERITVRGRFDDYGVFVKALHALQESGRREYEAYGPTSLVEVEDLMPRKESHPVRITATIGALFGMVSFWLMCGISAGIYSIVVGGKPPWANVPYVVPVYEGTILCGALGAFIAVLILMRARPRKPAKEYDTRFSGDQYGIDVNANPGDRQMVIDLLAGAGAAEVEEL